MCNHGDPESGIHPGNARCLLVEPTCNKLNTLIVQVGGGGGAVGNRKTQKNTLQTQAMTLAVTHRRNGPTLRERQLKKIIIITKQSKKKQQQQQTMSP